MRRYNYYYYNTNICYNFTTIIINNIYNNNIIVEIINKLKNKNKLTFVGFEPGFFCTRVLK